MQCVPLTFLGKGGTGCAKHPSSEDGSRMATENPQCTWAIAGFGWTALPRDCQCHWDCAGCRMHRLPLGRQFIMFVIKFWLFYYVFANSVRLPINCQALHMDLNSSMWARENCFKCICPKKNQANEQKSSQSLSVLLRELKVWVSWAKLLGFGEPGVFALTWLQFLALQPDRVA